MRLFIGEYRKVQNSKEGETHFITFPLSVDYKARKGYTHRYIYSNSDYGISYDKLVYSFDSYEEAYSLWESLQQYPAYEMSEEKSLPWIKETLNEILESSPLMKKWTRFREGYHKSKPSVRMGLRYGELNVGTFYDCLLFPYSQSTFPHLPVTYVNKLYIRFDAKSDFNNTNSEYLEDLKNFGDEISDLRQLMTLLDRTFQKVYYHDPGVGLPP